MSEGKIFKHPILDTTIIIGLATVLAYYEGSMFYQVVYGYNIVFNMIPDVSNNNIFLMGGGILFFIATYVSTCIFVYKLLCNISSLFKDIKIKICLIILLISSSLLLIILLPRILGTWELLSSWGPYRICDRNKVLEIEFKSGKKIENIPNLKMIGKKDNFIVFLKGNGEIVAYSTDDILKIKLKNNSK